MLNVKKCIFVILFFVCATFATGYQWDIPLQESGALRAQSWAEGSNYLGHSYDLSNGFLKANVVVPRNSDGWRMLELNRASAFIRYTESHTAFENLLKKKISADINFTKCNVELSASFMAEILANYMWKGDAITMVAGIRYLGGRAFIDRATIKDEWSLQRMQQSADEKTPAVFEKDHGHVYTQEALMGGAAFFIYQYRAIEGAVITHAQMKFAADIKVKKIFGLSVSAEAWALAAEYLKFMSHKGFVFVKGDLSVLETPDNYEAWQTIVNQFKNHFNKRENWRVIYEKVNAWPKVIPEFRGEIDVRDAYIEQCDFYKSYYNRCAQKMTQSYIPVLGSLNDETSEYSISNSNTWYYPSVSGVLVLPTDNSNEEKIYWPDQTVINKFPTIKKAKRFTYCVIPMLQAKLDQIIVQNSNMRSKSINPDEIKCIAYPYENDCISKIMSDESILTILPK